MTGPVLGVHAQGVVRLWCLDKESWPDSNEILVHVRVTPLSECSGIILQDPSNPFRNAVIGLLTESGYLALWIQVTNTWATAKELPLAGRNGAGKWELSNWNPAGRFIVTDKSAVMILPPDTIEIEWSVEAYVYASEDNPWVGKGYGHRGRICFRCWRDE